MERAKTTFFDKVWAEHVIASISREMDLLQIDRLFLHELTGAASIRKLVASGRRPAQPELIFTAIDHLIDTVPDRGAMQSPSELGAKLIAEAREGSERYGFEFFGVGDPRQGIVHVISPELGIALPGSTLVCGDSHTCTVGGVGALGWGIGSTEGEHVLATQTLIQRKPKTMRISFEGELTRAVSAKDLILYLIGRFGVNCGAGHAVEFSGSVVRSLPVEARLTLCNMAVELSAKHGFVAPDDTTFQYLAGREYSPAGHAWDRAVDHWRGLCTADEARFDREETINCREIGPQVTWGISPQHVLPIDGVVPNPSDHDDLAVRQEMLRALTYMELTPGTRMQDVRIDVSYIGSCTNARLSDLRIAATVLKDRKIAPGVTGICIPGSSAVKLEAEREGLDEIFKNAGFEWHESGCGLCGHMGNDRLSNLRVISTTNRNFAGRQGPRTRTHLASPASAAAAAVAGRIINPQELMTGV
ncbi:3-isopropylmalate dehydratase large subunit [Bradyrhizobium sp. BR 10261]|uniref:3-isopropylmalate dehydratase large subunit n=1 Tax=Bradyrhizobium sp. BR 10261 TaxID=2749992 RepID=UPI001C64E613|nr:3-isopropylmalate dehydratase large subunit [Bradyrhizobium sp. BR 10261]MBW7967149.1 3-isopropylmalate dehydratase large subunit [Bradyrhizobium sp. BR 10261]